MIFIAMNLLSSYYFIFKIEKYIIKNYIIFQMAGLENSSVSNFIQEYLDIYKYDCPRFI